MSDLDYCMIFFCNFAGVRRGIAAMPIGISLIYNSLRNGTKTVNS